MADITPEVGVADLEKDIRVSSLSLRSREIVNSTPEKSEPELETLARKNWAPKNGRVYVNPSSRGTGNRYATQYMTWVQDNFGSSSGYEHDFFLNNSSGSTLGPGTYFSRAEKGGWRRYPDFEYASTSWPSSSKPYVDTRFGDGNVEISYTIGMVEADEIVANKEYFTYLRFKNGNASRDNAKLVAKRTGRNRAVCPLNPDQWCMFENDSQTIYKAWDLQIPASRRWWFNN